MIFTAACIILISFYFLKNIQYVPVKAVSASRAFLNLMKSGQFQQAYSLTIRKGMAGASFSQFTNKVYIEWTRHGGKEDCDAGIIWVSPGQSYGNLLSRYLKGKKAERDWIYINYHAGGIPFGIKMVSESNGNWEVANFESHAE